MAYTYTWDSAFEALPADANNVSDGANKIRNLKIALRERLAKDHYMDTAGTDADHGEHSQVTFHGNVATPSNIANKATLYVQLVANKLELMIKNNANQVTQITSDGAVNFTSPIPANTIMLFYADTAPSGWTLLDDANEWNDITVMITCGSANGGETGGANNANGSWTIDVANHVHPWGSFDASRELSSYQANGASIQVANTGSAATGSGTDKWYGTVASANETFYTTDPVAANSNAWRPASKWFIACEKD